MNNMETEFQYLQEKIYGKDDDEDRKLPNYQTYEQFFESEGEVISVEEDGKELVYKATNGSTFWINMLPRLYDALVEDGDIEPVKRTDRHGRIDYNAFAEHAKIKKARAAEYLAKLRAKIVAGEITV
jgi:hypothetical protein